MAEDDLLPELKRTLQSLSSAVQMLRQRQSDPAAAAFVCARAEKRLGDLVEGLEGRSPEGRRVLVADPDDGWAEVLAETLRLEGHAVRVASTAADTVAACAAFRPEVALVELAMTGHDAARNLRSGAEPPVLVAVSRWSRESDRQLALQAGFAHYLHKPVSPVAVARLVSTVPGSKPVPEEAPVVAAIKPRRRAGARKASA
jgi:CheY-like chemotaxis protein